MHIEELTRMLMQAVKNSSKKDAKYYARKISFAKINYQQAIQKLQEDTNRKSNFENMDT